VEFTTKSNYELYGKYIKKLECSHCGAHIGNEWENVVHYWHHQSLATVRMNIWTGERIEVDCTIHNVYQAAGHKWKYKWGWLTECIYAYKRSMTPYESQHNPWKVEVVREIEEQKERRRA